MSVTTTWRFKRITWTGVRAGRCSVCNKRTRRQRTFEQTESPFNVHRDGPKEGQRKSALEIQDAVKALAQDWESKYVLICTKCEAL